MREDEAEAFKALISDTIKSTVNGKIDKLTLLMDDHNKKHEEDMKMVKGHIEQVTPILEKYETFQKTVEGTQSVGKIVIGVAVFITSVGAAYLMLKQLITK